MELKLVRNNRSSSGGDVLIVPLWNWNGVEQGIEAHDVCSIRTFMELKFDEISPDELGRKF